MTPRDFWLIYDGKVRASEAIGGKMEPPTADEIEEFEIMLREKHRGRDT